MSTAASRLISGSLASWALIAVTIVSQIALVPVYLKYWSVEEYGIWLAIQAIINVLSTVDVGYQNFLGYEFFKFAKEDRPQVSRYLWSGICISIGISVAQILLIITFLASGALPILLGESRSVNRELMYAAGVVLLVQSFTWLICTTIVGLVSRALAPFGYFPRTAWWRFVHAIVTALAPLLAVVFGADLLIAGFASAAGLILYSIPVYFDLFKILHKEKVFFTSPSFTLGYSNFVRSLGVSARSLLENTRQQGVRLFIAPLAGAGGLAAFSTMRTGANVALQGLNTILNPIMPDLMRFLHDRDQERSEAAFATIWIVVVAFIAPGIVILQIFVEPFYIIWTQGKIPFDPILFALLSMGVLVFAVIQPAMAVVIGNNLLKPQLSISALAAGIVIAGLFILIPRIGILGAGIALLLAEIAAAIAYTRYAKRWLNNHSLMWPSKIFRISTTSVYIAAVTLGIIIAFPELRWLTAFISMVLFVWNVWRFWKVLPLLASQRARQIIVNLPGIRKMIL
jgi:O-antigen/teichoic acid export membrane protein